MKANVDQDLCIGCGMCTGVAPEVFQMNDDGKAEAYAEYDETGAALVDSAVDGCPVAAIQSDVE
ncbi:MAG: ferredoxin [Lachnospiraceae bacterium]|nr:ferredoxin [Lachnospiraceae bacterium]